MSIDRCIASLHTKQTHTLRTRSRIRPHRTPKISLSLSLTYWQSNTIPIRRPRRTQFLQAILKSVCERNNCLVRSLSTQETKGIIVILIFMTVRTTLESYMILVLYKPTIGPCQSVFFVDFFACRRYSSNVSWPDRLPEWRCGRRWSFSPETRPDGNAVACLCGWVHGMHPVSRREAFLGNNKQKALEYVPCFGPIPTTSSMGSNTTPTQGIRPTAVCPHGLETVRGMPYSSDGRVPSRSGNCTREK